MGGSAGGGTGGCPASAVCRCGAGEDAGCAAMAALWGRNGKRQSLDANTSANRASPHTPIPSRRAQAFDAAGDHAPDLDVQPLLGMDVRIGRVFRVQHELAVTYVQALAGEFAIHLGHHDVAVHGLEVFVHHQHVAVKHACAFHAVTRLPQDEDGLRVLRQFCSQVDVRDRAALRRTGTAAARGRCQHGQRHGGDGGGHGHAG